MDYIRLHTELLTNVKWLALSPRAKVLITQAWMFAGANETDGFVPDTARALIGHTPAAAKELEGQWWHRADGGWLIHDWLDHQVSKDALDEKRAKTNKRVAALRKRRRQDGGQLHAV